MNSPPPRISILLPVWNSDATLESCLRSVQRQSEPTFECVIVDDGSTDGSLDCARAMERRDSRFRVIASPHRGIVPSLIEGAAACRAPLIARMDADDWMHHDRLRRQAELLDREPGLEAVGCFPRIFPRRSLPDGRRAYEAWLHSLVDPETIWRDRFIECPVAHPTLMIRKGALEAVPYRDLGWPEDYDLMLRLLRKGPRVGMVTSRLLGWRDEATRLSRNHPDYALSRFTACRTWHLSRDFLDGRPEYVLWGYGRTGRALRKALLELGHEPVVIVDVHPRRIGQRIHGTKVIPPENLTDHRDLPIIASVSGLGPRTEIRSALGGMDFREGIDFVVAA